MQGRRFICYMCGCGDSDAGGEPGGCKAGRDSDPHFLCCEYGSAFRRCVSETGRKRSGHRAGEKRAGAGSFGIRNSRRMRREVAEYALRFLGGEYVYGGTDPNEGVDCSGFTRYVLSKAASIDLPHSSRGQADFGTAVMAGFCSV